jgi:hypothetical protein
MVADKDLTHAKKIRKKRLTREKRRRADEQSANEIEVL